MNRGPVEIETLLSITPCFHSTDEINFTWYFLSSLDWREDDSESKFCLISLLPGKYQYCELFTFLLLFSHYFMLSFFSILFFYSRIGFIIFCQYNVLKVIAHQHQWFVIILNFYTTKFPVSISFISKIKLTQCTYISISLRRYLDVSLHLFAMRHLHSAFSHLSCVGKNASILFRYLWLINCYNSF